MKRIKDYFLKDVLSNSNSYAEKAKILMLFHITLSYIALPLICLPIAVVFIPNLMITINIVLSVLLYLGTLYSLKHQSLKVTALIFCFGQFFLSFVANTLLGNDVSIIVVGWYLIIILIASFTLNIRYGMVFAVLTVLAIALNVIFLYTGISNGSKIHFSELHAVILFPVLTAFVLLYLLYIIYVFIRTDNEAWQELDQTRKEAIEALKSKDQFLSIMSHEIRTPMNAIIGLSDVMIEDTPKKDHLNLLQTLRKSAENLKLLTNDVLDFAKIEQKKLLLEKEPINFKELIENIVASFSVECGKKKNKITLNYQNSLPHNLKGDSLRLSQVMTNLISNAVKFTDGGEIVISVEGVKQDINSHTFYVEVSDNGIGIKRDMLNRIFDAFTQESSSTTREYGGSGLGLAITQKLLDLMGSSIYVNSQEGVGSTFYFVIELETYNAPKEPNKKEGAKLNLNGKRILVAEDNEFNQIVIERFIKSWNCEFDLVENGRLAVEMSEDISYAVILMDLQMPEMDGEEATRIIKENDPKQPIIALTADVSEATAKVVKSVGFDALITKPVNKHELEDAIRKVLR